MNAQKLYDFILNLRKNNPLYEKDTIRLFNFLYDGVRGYITNIIDMEDSDETFVNMRDEIDEIIDGDNSIFDYYVKMINDNKKEFINKFYENVNNSLDFFDNKLYRDNDFRPFTYIFNIYIMLKLYDIYKDDFDKFSSFVDEFSFFIGYGELDENYSDNREYTLFREKLDFINRFLENKVIEDFPEAKKMIIDFVKDICSTHYYDDLEDLDDKALNVLKLFDDIRRIREYPSFNQDVLSKFLTSLFNDDEDEELYYSSILMLGDRYQYFEDMYDVIDNGSIYNEILDRVSDLEIDLFEELNDSNDSFIEIMNVVFDSDSFYEMESKLETLEEASNLYSCQGLTKECLDLIKSLRSDEHKKEIEGITIKYSSSSINKIDKPERIIDRSYDILKLSSDLLKYSTDDFEDVLIYSDTMSECDDRFSSFIYGALSEKKEQERKTLPTVVEAVQRIEEAKTEEGLPNKDDNSFQKIKSIFGRRK
ncbi:MAG: hypothetical protein IJN90_06565 [Bacilli bacterium]|nr:hypothetical protein [Bacilli bacterium]